MMIMIIINVKEKLVKELTWIFFAESIEYPETHLLFIISSISNHLFAEFVLRFVWNCERIHGDKGDDWFVLIGLFGDIWKSGGTEIAILFPWPKT